MPRNLRKRLTGQFVALPYKLIDSQAWKEISPSAKAVYIELMRQRNGANDNALKLPYCQMNTPKRTAVRAIKELLAVGMIRMVHQGGLFRSMSVYGISNSWMHYKAPSFVENGVLPGRAL